MEIIRTNKKPTMTRLSEEDKRRIIDEFKGFMRAESTVLHSKTGKSYVDAENLLDLWLDIIDRELRRKVEEVRSEIENYSKTAYGGGVHYERHDYVAEILSLPPLGAEGLEDNDKGDGR